MRKLILVILGFFFTGGSLASCDLLGKKENQKPAKKEEKCDSCCKTCQREIFPKYERRW